MFATSGQAELAYDVTGDGAAGGSDVLLIHAGVTDMRSWHSVVDRLAGRHRCIRYDARGYGQTRYARQDGWSPVADAVAVLDAAGSRRAVVVAGSMGGATAIDLALGHPEQLAGRLADSRLVLLDGVGHLPQLEGDPATLEVVSDFVDSLAP